MLNVLDLSKKLILALSVAAPAMALAQGPKATPVPAPSAREEKLDVTDLEKKYWAAKDSDFNVVQNRLYSKANRFSLSAGYGTIISESWSENPTMGANLAYYFSERWGMEATYATTMSKDNKDTERLKTQGGYPNHNLLKNFYGLQANWVPFYAKMSFLNSSIVYFDMGVSLGAGVSSYEQLKEEGTVMQSAPTLTLDVHQQFFLNKWLAVRADFKNRFFNEERVWYKQSSVPSGGSRVDTTDLKNVQIIMLGLTVYY